MDPNPFDQFDTASVVSGVKPSGDTDNQQSSVNAVQQVGANPQNSSPNPFDAFDKPIVKPNPGAREIQEPSALTSASGHAADMATFGLGKYAAGAGAAAANMVKAPLTGDFSPGEAYVKGVNQYEDQLQNESREHPIASDVGNVAGFGASFGQAGPKMVAATAPIREAAASTTLGKGINARTGDELEEAAQNIKTNANQKYQEYRDAGLVLSPEAGQQAVQQIEDSMGRISPNRHSGSLDVLNDLKSRAEEGNLSLEDLDDYRQDFRDVHNDNTDFTGRTRSDGYKSTKAIDALDGFVDNLQPEHLISGDPAAVDALNDGRQTWAQYKKFDSVANVVKQADGDPNRLKAGLTRFLNKGKNTAGWSDDEVEALQNAARNSTGEKLLKTVGKFGIDLGSSLSPGNTALPALTGLTGLGGGHGAPLVAAGTVARQGQKWLGRGKAEDLLQTIEQNTPPPRTPKPTYDNLLDAAQGRPNNQARGGRITKLHSGAVYQKPRYYPALKQGRVK